MRCIGRGPAALASSHPRPATRLAAVIDAGGTIDCFCRLCDRSTFMQLTPIVEGRGFATATAANPQRLSVRVRWSLAGTLRPVLSQQGVRAHRRRVGCAAKSRECRRTRETSRHFGRRPPRAGADKPGPPRGEIYRSSATTSGRSSSSCGVAALTSRLRGRWCLDVGVHGIVDVGVELFPAAEESRARHATRA